MSEIDQLVSEYNQVEQQQTERLARLFRLMDARKNYRHVKFTDGAWSNCWGRPERLAIPAFVEVMARQITEVVPGDE
jgi:hypothetical protein